MTRNDPNGAGADQPAASARPPAAARPQPSRRAMLRSAAGAGLAATAAASVGGSAFAAVARPAQSQASGHRQVADTVAEHDGEAIVAHLRDAGSGEIDLFHGTRQIRLRDRELAARLIRASR
jgi:hypothetical protein